MVKSDNPANAPPHPVQAEVQAAATASHQEVTPTDFQSYNFCVLQFLSAAYAIRELGPDAQPDAVKSAATLLLSWRTDYFSLMHRDEVFEIFMMLAGSRNSIAHGQAFDFAARAFEAVWDWRDDASGTSSYPTRPTKRLGQLMLDHWKHACGKLAGIQPPRLDQLKQDMEVELATAVHYVRQPADVKTAMIQRFAAMRGQINPRLTVDVENQQATLDGDPYRLPNRESAIFVQALIDAKGDWQSSTDISATYPEFEGARPDRLKRKLPTPIQSLIESAPAKGSRIPINRLA